MFGRICIALFLSGLAAFTSACANSGNPAALPSLSTGSSALFAHALRDVKIREFSDLPQYADYYLPSSIAAAADGKLWVTDTIDQDLGENVVVGIATSGRRRDTFYYRGSSLGASFQDITAGSDGALWITDTVNQQIVRMTTSGAFSNYPLHGYGDYTTPFSITSGSDRALWFTANIPHGNAIGRITTHGRVTLYDVPESEDIAAGPDRALWFTEYSANRIGRMTTHGNVSQYSKGITAGSLPLSIAPGPDGAVWFTEAAGRIGRITTAGKVTEYSRGITPTEKPIDLAAGSDGAMWFTEYETYGSYYQVRESKIGRITMSGKITEYSKLDPTSLPTTIVQGPDGNVWFVETDADRVGRIAL